MRLGTLGEIVAAFILLKAYVGFLYSHVDYHEENVKVHDRLNALESAAWNSTNRGIRDSAQTPLSLEEVALAREEIHALRVRTEERAGWPHDEPLKEMRLDIMRAIERTVLLQETCLRTGDHRFCQQASEEVAVRNTRADAFNAAQDNATFSRRMWYDVTTPFRVLSDGRSS